MWPCVNNMELTSARLIWNGYVFQIRFFSMLAVLLPRPPFLHCWVPIRCHGILSEASVQEIHVAAKGVAMWYSQNLLVLVQIASSKTKPRWRRNGGGKSNPPEVQGMGRCIACWELKIMIKLTKSQSAFYITPVCWQIWTSETKFSARVTVSFTPLWFFTEY